MTAVLGGDRDEVLAAIEAQGLVAANNNGPGQVVAAGTMEQLQALAHNPPPKARLVPLSVAEPELTHEINVEGTRNVLRAAREAGVKSVVLASSAAVYGDDPEMPKHEEMATKPLSPYATSKLENERDAARFTEEGLPVVALRFFNVYGPRQNGDHPYASAVARFKDAVESGRPVQIFGDGMQTRDFVHVRDVVRDIEQLNGMSSVALTAGQEILLPVAG